MLKATRSKATEHIAAAWSHIEEGNPRACLMELDKAMELLRPDEQKETATPLPRPKQAAELPVKRVTPKGVGARNKPVESPDDWWSDSVAAATALNASPMSVRNACNGSRPCETVRGVKVWYSCYATREAWEAARRQSEVAA